MIDSILVVILLFVIGGASLYLYKAKKSGQKCIGCPYAKQCSRSKCTCGQSEGND